jgi:hypothetical protein
MNLSSIVSPDGEDPARWRVRVIGHAGTGIMCGMLFTDGVCAEPARDTQARKILAAIGVGVVVEPWEASPRAGGSIRSGCRGRGRGCGGRAASARAE